MNAWRERPEFAGWVEFAAIGGVVRDLDASIYHAVEAMSASGAKKMLQSPAHYLVQRTQPNEPTAQMQFGTVVHCGVLEPHTLDARVICAPKIDRRTKEGKAAALAFETESAGKIALAPDDYSRARRCIDAVLAHPAAYSLLDGGEVEGSMFWEDVEYGVPCRARPDSLNHGGIVDVKTAADASPEGFGRAAANLLYHCQAAHYMSGAEHVLDATPQFFAFVVVETDEPYPVACYTLEAQALHVGRHKMDTALSRYRAALETGDWPGYSEMITPLHLPAYAMRVEA